MNWYIAKLVFNIDIDNGSHNSQFDEQWRLIMAENQEQAFVKARALGKSEEDSFLNINEKHVKWNFIDVPFVQFQELRDGSELYSITHEAQESGTYINFIKDKALLNLEKSRGII